MSFVGKFNLLTFTPYIRQSYFKININILGLLFLPKHQPRRPALISVSLNASKYFF